MSAQRATTLQIRWEMVMPRAQKWSKMSLENPRLGQHWLDDLHTLVYDTREHLGMATKGKNEKVTWKGFANVDIPSDKKDAAKKVILDAEKTVERASNAIASGYKLSVAYNGSNDSFVATLTCNDAKSANAGYSLSGFGKDWLIALGSVLYKHYDVSKEKWSEHTQDADELFG